MLLNKKKYRLVAKVIEAWKERGLLSEEKSHELKNSLEIASVDWRRLARYSFWIAGISLGIAVFALLLDDAIMALIEQIIRLPDIVKSLLLAIIAALLYFWGFRRKNMHPAKNYTSESILFAGAVVTGSAIIFLGQALDTGSGHFSLLILMATLVYLLIGGLFPSVPMWVLGLLSMSAWFGTETGYASGWGAYFLGMNYPLRFVIFGILMVTASFLLEKTRLSRVAKSTYSMGLLNAFLALWIMSLFGNYGDMGAWHAASALERFIWSLIFGIAALVAIFHGLRQDDGVARGFGITFLFINLYTKYFEYFWEVAHKAIFFAILALSFWLLGRYAEEVYNKLKEKIIDFQDE